VYCDLVQDSFNGLKLAPLLGFVNIAGHLDSVMHKYCDRVRYRKMEKKAFQTASVDIKDVNVVFSCIA